MEKQFEINLEGVTEISSFGTSGCYIQVYGTSEFNDEIDIMNLKDIIDYLDDNEYIYTLEYPNIGNDEMPEDEWVINIISE